MSLFPIMQPQAARKPANSGLFTEIAWNFEENRPIYKNDMPVIVTGKEAVTVWAWHALQTPRYEHEIFTWSFGNEVESLIGKPLTDELKQSEAARYVSECLMVNPYITDVSDISVAFGNDSVEITCTIKTIYGEVTLDV